MKNLPHIVSRFAEQQPAPSVTEPERKYVLERVGSARVVQLYADGFEKLTQKEKIFAYYVSQATIAGRDIAIDQHHRNALEIRDLLEKIYLNNSGIDQKTLVKITVYLKLFWINNGFYDNITSKKIQPEFTFEELRAAAKLAQINGAVIRTGNEDIDTKLFRLKRVIFNMESQPMLTNKTPGEDYIRGSAINYYRGDLSYEEVRRWSALGFERNPLNSTVFKENNAIVEKVWRCGGEGVPAGLYAEDLLRVIHFLELAIPYAETEHQQKTIHLLIKYFKTGHPNDFRNFNIHWIKDISNIDFIMGFIEVYLDPCGKKGEWEASVYYTDPGQTILMEQLARFAQYFEDKMPWAPQYKKKIIHSPTAKVINVIVETGGTGPISPIGINLPNEQALRQMFGSKSVLLRNVADAYEKSSGKDLLFEFAWDDDEIKNQDLYGTRADNLHTALHEVIGHGSGKMSDHLIGDPSHFLPGYFNTLEEARADLVALWCVFDTKLIETGIVDNIFELRKIGETMFQQAIRVALTQLRRIGDSDHLEEDHMKNRQLIAHYLMDDFRAVRKVKRGGSTYYRIIDFERAHYGVGRLLAEIMRIKAEGDLKSAKSLIDKYALKVDSELRVEVQNRVRKLDAPAYTGFVMPKLVPAKDSNDNIVDVEVTYPLDLSTQMFEFSSFTKNHTDETAK
ncbi:MAG: peptidase M49 [Bacteroidota bacterium]